MNDHSEILIGIVVALAALMFTGIGLLIGLADSEIKYMKAYNEQHCRRACVGGDPTARFKDGKFACLCTRVVP